MTPFDLVGDAFPPFRPPGTQRADAVAAVTRATDECQSVIDDWTAKLRGIVADCLAGCVAGSADCVSCVSGSVARLIDQADAVTGKCRDRLLSHAFGLLGESYSRAETLTGPPPSMEQVIADITVGRIGAPEPTPTPEPEPPIRVDSPVYQIEWKKRIRNANELKFPLDCYPDGDIFQAGPGPDGVFNQCAAGQELVDLGDGLFGCIVPKLNCFPSPPPPAPPPIQPPPPPPPSTCPPPTIQLSCPPATADKPKPEPVCKPGEGDPPEPECPAPRTDLTGVTMPDFGTESVCEFLERFDTLPGEVSTHLSTFLGLRNEKDGKPTFPKWLDYGIVSQIPFLRPIVASAFAWTADMAEKLIGQLPFPASCNTKAALTPRLLSIVVGAAERWLGDGFSPLQTTLEYWSNYHCPTRIPGAGEATDLYNRGYIQNQTWECLVRANGVHPHYQRMAQQIMQGAVSPVDFITLARRGRISRAHADKRIQQTTGMDRSEIDFVEYLSRYVPGPGDLVRFMVRDVFDPKVVEEYGLHDEFDDKFQGMARDWAEGQGISPETMKAYWAAHWDWPSPTQLYTMLHRLYDGSPNLKPGQRPVTERDVEVVLGIDDVTPIWRERMVQISYRPMTRVDTRRAYCIGAINDVELYHNLKQLGYDERTTGIMVRYYQADKARGCLQSQQLVSWKQVLMNYVNGFQTWQETFDQLERLGVTRVKISEFQQQADYARTIKRRKELAKVIKKNYTIADMNESQAVGALASIGYPVDAASDMVGSWKQTRKSQGKLASASELCRWFDKGLLPVKEYRARLIGVGWTAADADRIVNSCSIDLERKRAKATEAAEAKAAKAREKREREESNV